MKILSTTMTTAARSAPNSNPCPTPPVSKTILMKQPPPHTQEHSENQENTTNHTTRSVPIHIQGMQRTPSEVQLLHDEALADYRDYCMFSRIVNGIRQQHRQPTDQILNHIIRTRNLPAVDVGPESVVPAQSYQAERSKYPSHPLPCHDMDSFHQATFFDRPITIIEHDDDRDGGDAMAFEDEGVFFMDDL